MPRRSKPQARLTTDQLRTRACPVCQAAPEEPCTMPRRGVIAFGALGQAERLEMSYMHAPRFSDVCLARSVGWR